MGGADGAYAQRPFLPRALRTGVVVVSRLRKDAALGSVPAPVQPGTRRRGRPRKYGSASISLAKRAGQRRGWQKGDFVLYGTKGGKQYKTFLATDQLVGGWIRVVLVKEAEHGVAYVCPPVEGTVADIREAVADRRAIEQTVHDLKEAQRHSFAKRRDS